MTVELPSVRHFNMWIQARHIFQGHPAICPQPQLSREKKGFVEKCVYVSQSKVPSESIVVVSVPGICYQAAAGQGFPGPGPKSLILRWSLNGMIYDSECFPVHWKANVMLIISGGVTDACTRRHNGSHKGTLNGTIDVSEIPVSGEWGRPGPIPEHIPF